MSGSGSGRGGWPCARVYVGWTRGLERAAGQGAVQRQSARHVLGFADVLGLPPTSPSDSPPPPLPSPRVRPELVHLRLQSHPYRHRLLGTPPPLHVPPSPAPSLSDISPPRCPRTRPRRRPPVPRPPPDRPRRPNEPPARPRRGASAIVRQLTLIARRRPSARGPFARRKMLTTSAQPPAAPWSCLSTVLPRPPYVPPGPTCPPLPGPISSPVPPTPRPLPTVLPPRPLLRAAPAPPLAPAARAPPPSPSLRVLLAPHAFPEAPRRPHPACYRPLTPSPRPLAPLRPLRPRQPVRANRVR